MKPSTGPPSLETSLLVRLSRMGTADLLPVVLAGSKGWSSSRDTIQILSVLMR